MSNLTLPPPIATQLANLPHVTSLRDVAGKKLGYFVPAVDPADYEILGDEPSAEELRQIEASTEWCSTEEVLSCFENRRDVG